MYGSTYCSHCHHQKALFGDAIQYVGQGGPPSGDRPTGILPAELRLVAVRGTCSLVCPGPPPPED